MSASAPVSDEGARVQASGLRLAVLQAAFGWLHVVITVPSVYLWLGLPLVMRQHGWSGLEIGLFQLAGLPALLKFLLAMPVDGRGAAVGAGPGRYRAWAAGLGLALAVVLLLIGRQPLLGSRVELFVLAALAALLVTWLDVPVNALAIRLLPPAQRMRAGGVRSAALSVGAIVGGGVMLLVHGRYGWRLPFGLMAAGLLVAVVLLPWLRASVDPVDAAPTWADRVSGRASKRAAFADEFRAYLAQPGGAAWTLLLVTCFPFVGAAWFYLKPLLLDHGLPADDVARLAGIGGGAVAALASLAAAPVLRRLGAARAVVAVGGLNVLALSVLAAVTVTTAGPGARAGFALWVAPVGLLAVALGVAATLAFGLTLQFTRPGRDAVDYGLQASLFALTRLLVPVAAGGLVDAAGFGGMLAALLAAAVLAWGLAWRLRASLAGA
jgi:MFS transporter, PAT family, beta-lactamase induction signal transducer AmpG